MDHQQQPYDASLKDLFREQAQDMMQYLLEGARFIEELNAEVLKPHPPLRADGIYKIFFRGEDHVLHTEFQIRGDKKLPRRLASYNVLIHEEFNLPVISLILFPFRTTLPETPYRVMSGDQEIFKLEFFPVGMWKFNAQHLIDERAKAMYPLLPTMEGASARLIIQAIQELALEYNGEKLSRRLVCLRTLMQRVKALPDTDKRAVEEHLAMFDELLEEDPYILKIKAKAEARGKAEGEVEGEAKGKVEGRTEALKESVIDVIEMRFPALSEYARERVRRISVPDVLKVLVKRLVNASDEEDARSILAHPVA